MINSVTLSRTLQVYQLRKKERGILEYLNNYIDKIKASDIPITPFCQCQNSGLKVNNTSGWCESCGLGLVPGVMLPPWTSGHPEINRIIFHTQIKSNHIFDHIEWINYDRFTNVKKIIKGVRGDGYSASWIDGPMYLYGMARNGEQNVIIKSLGKSSSNVTPEFLRELESYVKLVTSYTELRYELLGSVQCYGLTRDPNTQEYMLVTEYIKGGDLRNYLSKNFKNMKWLDHKLKILISIAKGLKLIHESGFIHQDLHLGNILIGKDGSAYISDLGLYPFITLSDQDSKKESTPKGIFGVLPYVAPEVLERILPYTKESDIYSFGIIMWSLSSGKLPFSGCPFNTSLALEICNGERPEININETPQCYIDLMKRCWDSEPHKRPNIQEIYEILLDWYFLINEYEEFKKFDEMIKSDIEEKSTIFESEDVVHYSQFIDLDAISKEETFEVLDDDDLYSAKPYNIGTPSDVSTN
ncbi:kinase-like domain-containing protein [Gigaspora rosea]|uniref:Kinase-like domain-containing protein n=1 Tax=Gigaspora rosea TaxID=44941 RepID=A0A397U3C8_9GLOM|nr:kinase-like domain-containing protein [Gigaspora rosea]